MRIIGHLDMDAFFAAIEERDSPRFRGLPVVVGANPEQGQGRGVVSTANYQARQYGIHSAMPISKAWQLSETAKTQGKPAAIFVEPNINRYVEVSENIMNILRKKSPLVEQTSIDEAFFELSFCGNYKKAKKISQEIKKEIRQKEKLTASIGIGPNKLIAKIASDFKKPDGLIIVGSDDQKTCPELVEGFLEPLPIKKIPGIGPKTEALFVSRGAETVADLKKYSEAELTQLLGQWGLELYEKLRGNDNSPLEESYEIKSIGEQETFPKDTKNFNYIFERLQEMAKNIIKRMEKEGFKNFRTIVLIVRFSGFETKTRSHTLEKPTNHLSVLQFEALKMLTPFLDRRQNPYSKPIRLIGLRVEKLNCL